ncbi:hypothetical protein [Bailinhaonella thermotolerans]|uniref:hypothetical protein n=1 Tax=Bailinhaonella thermotolerans TaxID=1070861 RepID=UPI00192A4386|nr:hypothetical protein [Bailinhaonella thermotolerans]
MKIAWRGSAPVLTLLAATSLTLSIAQDHPRHMISAQWLYLTSRGHLAEHWRFLRF